jgi:hypothetical protein
MERMGDFLDECIDQEVFTELQPSVILEMSSYIKEFEAENEQKLPMSFYKYWSIQT